MENNNIHNILTYLKWSIGSGFAVSILFNLSDIVSGLGFIIVIMFYPLSLFRVFRTLNNKVEKLNTYYVSFVFLISYYISHFIIQSIILMKITIPMVGILPLIYSIVMPIIYTKNNKKTVDIN